MTKLPLHGQLYLRECEELGGEPLIAQVYNDVKQASKGDSRNMFMGYAGAKAHKKLRKADGVIGGGWVQHSEFSPLDERSLPTALRTEHHSIPELVRVGDRFVERDSDAFYKKFNAGRRGPKLARCPRMTTISAGMTDSSDAFYSKDVTCLRQRLRDDGYIFVRNCDTAVAKRCATAREVILEQGRNMGLVDEECGATGAGVTGVTADPVTGDMYRRAENEEHWRQWREVGQQKDVKYFYTERSQQLLDSVFGGAGKADTIPDVTWLRLQAPNDVTDTHSDYWYFWNKTDLLSGDHGVDVLQQGAMFHDHPPPSFRDTRWCPICKRGRLTEDSSSRPAKRSKSAKPTRKDYDPRMPCRQCSDAPVGLFTLWQSLCNIADLEHCPLALCPGTHLSECGFDTHHIVPKSWYVEGSPHFAETKVEHNWVYPDDVKPGDFILFNVKTIHASSENKSDVFRVSVDTRVRLRDGS